LRDAPAIGETVAVEFKQNIFTKQTKKYRPDKDGEVSFHLWKRGGYTYHTT
jgi:hypothetical protein